MGETLSNYLTDNDTFLFLPKEQFVEMTECEAIAAAYGLPELLFLTDNGYFNANAFAVLHEQVINRLYIYGGMLKRGTKIFYTEFEQTRIHVCVLLKRAGLLERPKPKEQPNISHWHDRNDVISRRLHKGGSHYGLFQRRTQNIHRGQGRYSKQK